MRSLAILFALFLGALASAPVQAITADEALSLTYDSVARTTFRNPNDYQVSVACKSIGGGSFRMTVTQSCGGVDQYTSNIWILNHSDIFWINEYPTDEVACGVAEYEFQAYLDDNHELRQAKRTLAKYCKEQLSAY